MKSVKSGTSATLQPIRAFLIIPFGSRGDDECERVMNGPVNCGANWVGAGEVYVSDQGKLSWFGIKE